MKKRVLIAEDAKMFSRILKSKIEGLGFDVTVSETMASAIENLENQPDAFFLALLDLNLPDAPHGQIVDYVIGKNIPCIVFTGEFSDEIREQMIQKNVVDYITKESPYSIDFVVDLVNRIHKNQYIKVLVVDDSPSARNYLHTLLTTQQYQVVEAENGAEALELLEQHGDIKVVITDYVMPIIDGFELTKKIRQKYGSDDLAILGMSAHGNNILSAKFIKNGASDFITKPFLVEEFHCRVRQNVEILNHIQALRDSLIRDYLTGLHNRRYFYDIGAKLFASARRDQIQLTAAMIDIDQFKQINDTYGHEAGDKVLQHIGKILKNSFRETDIIARYGGEEFCALLVNIDKERQESFFKQLLKKIESMEVPYGDETIRITASVGACSKLKGTLDASIRQADKYLYKAKYQGKNRVILDE